MITTGMINLFMLLESRIIQFPAGQLKDNTSPTRNIKNIDGIKYFSQQQIKLLRRTVRDRATLHLNRGQVTAVREWAAIDLLTTSGL